MWFVHVHDDYILHFPFKLLKSCLLGGKKMLWIILLQYVKTMIDDTAPRNKPQ